MIRRGMIMAAASAVLLSGCGTSAGSGAYGGAILGTILGSAIGGIVGGPRGADIGTVVGMAGGAVVGGVAAEQAEQAERQERHERYERIQQQRYGGQQQGDYDAPIYNNVGDTDGVFDPNNGGDDRLYDFHGPDYTGSYSASRPTTSTPATSSVEELVAEYAYSEAIEIVNARFVDDNRDNLLSRGELCKVIFEVRNRSDKTLHDVVPTVVEAENNPNIFISPSVHVESLAPGQAIRYTAMVKASNRLKNGSARFCLSVLQGGRTISKVTEFDITTTKNKLK